MKTQRTHLLKVTVTLVSLVIFVSISTLRAQDNHYKPDFIRQMVYQLSSEVIDRSGLIKLTMKQSETHLNEEILTNWNIPVSHPATSSSTDESERMPLEEFLLKAAQPYQAATSFDCGNEQADQPTDVGSELEELLIRAARHDPGSFSTEVPFSNVELEESLLKAVMYNPPKMEE